MTLEMTRAGETGVILTRLFEAPPEALFHAHTRPDLIEQWMLGPEGWTMTECRTDPREGGGFTFEYTHGDGRRFTISGTYLEVAPPGRIRHREVMSMPEGETRTDIESRFHPHEGGTRLEVALGYANEALRDAILSQGMQEGMEASYARLDALLAGTVAS